MHRNGKKSDTLDAAPGTVPAAGAERTVLSLWLNGAGHRNGADADPPRSVLIIGAHPDDEVLGVGGTIARHVHQGDRVSVLILTDGVTAHHNATELQKTAARKACQALGVHRLQFADFPDERLDSLPLLDVIRPIAAAIRELRPQILYTHHRGDANQDHRVAFAATLVAARPFGEHPVQRVLCYEVASSTEWGPPFAEWAFLPTVYVDISATLGKKLKAFEAYRDTFISEVKPFPHPRSREALRVYARQRGIEVGMHAAEAFVLVRDLLVAERVPRSAAGERASTMKDSAQAAQVADPIVGE
jgi:N-acetylglucosamine malate deacetylase 1